MLIVWSVRRGEQQPTALRPLSDAEKGLVASGERSDLGRSADRETSVRRPRIRTSQVAIAIGVEPTMMLTVGTVAELSRANSVSLRSNDTPVRIEADEAVSLEHWTQTRTRSPEARLGYLRTSCRHVTEDQPYS
jgi:hypothetical protein